LSALAGAVRSRREYWCVTEPRRRERTAKLLIAHLDTLGQAAPGIPQSERERLIERAAVATMRAVELELLEPERAVEIWHEALVRHPGLPSVELEATTQLAA
jgi:hypothetical protein